MRCRITPASLPEWSANLPKCAIESPQQIHLNAQRIYLHALCSTWTDLRIVSLLSCAHTTTRTDIKLQYLCVRVGSGGRVPATPVRQPRRKLHSHARYNDLVSDQHGGKILQNFSSVLIVNKWSVMFSRCTTTFHSDGLVNW